MGKNNPKGPPKVIYQRQTQPNITKYASFPPKLEPLLTSKARWIVLHGGRGGGKTVSIAKMLLLKGKEKPIRVLCCREVMQSMRESVHKTLEECIYELGLQTFYTVERYSIFGPVIDGKRTEFIFAGLKHNPQQIKSFANLDYAWVEEAHTVSEYSWTILSPTIRNPGSQIIVSFNPEHEFSATYQRFIKNPPADSVVIQINYWDNPWFAEPLLSEMEEMKARDYEKYLHVWCGETIKHYEGAVYLSELRQMEIDGRICEVPYRSEAPCEVYLDLGYSDFTALWVAQPVGDFIHVIDYHQNRQKPLDYYLKWCESKPYVINRYWLPHDARQRTAAQPHSYESLMRAKGQKVRIIPVHLVADGINALRTLFPRLKIDRKNCAIGIDALRHYRYELEDDERGGLKSVPVHDIYAHGADAARYMAVALKEPQEQKLSPSKYHNANPFRGGQSNWMGL
jgi:phage terminase large subunit